MMLMTGCGTAGAGGPGPEAASQPGAALPDTPVVLGAPYAIQGVTYTPVDVADYDEVGYASIYAEDRGSDATANGEPYASAAISAAHRTLPLPSYVEVTALDTGRTILVRVNDRGPMANDRLIELSPGAAEQLGLTAPTTGVRVRRVNPPAAERAQLRAGGSVPERLPTPDSLLSILRTKLAGLPAPVVAAEKPTVEAKAAPATAAPPAERIKPGADRVAVEGEAPPTASAQPKPTVAQPQSAKGGYVVQVAVFGSKANADATAKSLGGTVTRSGNLWRVTMGPFGSEPEAKAAQGKAKANGFADALIRVER